MQLNSDSFCDSVRIWMEVIGHLWAELGFWFSQKRGSKYSRPRTFEGSEHFDRSCRYNKPVQYGRDAAHISWADLWADSTWGLHGGEATPSERRALQPDWEGDRSWRFCRAQIVRAWTPTFAAANIFYRPQRFQRAPCYCRILWDANILYMAQTFYVCADISWAQIFHERKHFVGANISWAQTFHGRKHFMGANISWAQTFHGREYFNVSKYFVCKLLL